MKSTRIRFLWSFHGLRPRMHPERPNFLLSEIWARAVFVTAGSCLRPRLSFMLRYHSTCRSGMAYEILCMLWAPAPECTFVTFIYQLDLPIKKKPQISETSPHYSLSGFLTLTWGHYTQVTCKLPRWEIRIGEPSISITFRESQTLCLQVPLESAPPTPVSCLILQRKTLGHETPAKSPSQEDHPTSVLLSRHFTRRSSTLPSASHPLHQYTLKALGAKLMFQPWVCFLLSHLPW